MHHRVIEIIVGLFILAGLVGLVILAFEVSGLSRVGGGDYYQLNAEFDDVGSLKPRAQVSMSGVTIGRVKAISIDRVTFRAKVVLDIQKQYDQLPSDSAASIFTEGLLGSNYIHLEPGVSETALKPGGEIETTHSALILENIIGQLLYSFKSSTSEKNTSSAPAAAK